MSKKDTYLITGGCGFIGSNFIISEMRNGSHVTNVDNLSYAADLDNIAEVTWSG